MDFHALRPGKLIIVDDDPHVRAALKFSFEADGCEVVTLRSGEELIREMQHDSGDCIIIDERLPGRSGLQTIAQLRDAGVNTPAVLITTHPSNSVRRRAHALGVEIIEKPLIGDALARRVAALIAG
jgi:FixJ family two-component response regulator